jgi:acyl dehydratase
MLIFGWGFAAHLKRRLLVLIALPWHLSTGTCKHFSALLVNTTRFHHLVQVGALIFVQLEIVRRLIVSGMNAIFAQFFTDLISAIVGSSVGS